MAVGDVQAAWAWLLVSSLADAGVAEVVISPGSRSTPLVLAAHRLASEGALRCHDVIDERCAGFFALGLARASGRPPLLLCTSGSAGAHYLPALLEARRSFLPLLVLTADRPVELAHCGANQTVDQIKLYGDQVVAFFDLGGARGDDHALRAVRRFAAQAVARSRAPVPGGVHLNARLGKPLEPDGGDPDAMARAAAVRDRPICQTSVPLWSAASDALDAFADLLGAAERPLVMAGPAALAQADDRPAIEALAAILGAPLLAESTSQLRFRGHASEPDAPAVRAEIVRADAVDLLLASPPGGQLPDAVVQVGAPPTAAAWAGFLPAVVEAGGRHAVLAADGWPDARSTASVMLIGAPDRSARALADRLARADGARPAASGWAAGWAAADARAWQAADRLLDEQAGLETLSEAAAVVRAAGSVPAGGLLAVGNSLPVRLLDAWVPGAAVDGSVGVIHQRGTSGIDGLVSGAAGAALASGRPTMLLLGDVSLVHDLGGLALAARPRSPLVVVVLDNGGGRIFDLLPIAQGEADDVLDHFRTPHDTHFQHAAATFGVAHARAASPAALERALADAWQRPGATLIEATVPPGAAADDLAARRRAFEAA